MLKQENYNQLAVSVFETREEMGAAAAQDAAARIKRIIAAKGEANVVFAAAPSQNEVLDALAASDVPFDKVNALHMDEYIGLPADAPQGFGNFLRRALFDRVPFKSVQLIAQPDIADPDALVARYRAILTKYPPDMVVMGIGENGHIAFNDPGVARFDDPDSVKIASLDTVCRTQQVHDGCFAQLSDVPEYAITLTIPALMAAPEIVAVVPAASKAEAVRLTLLGAIAETCPASILRDKKGAAMYLDKASAKYIL